LTATYEVTCGELTYTVVDGDTSTYWAVITGMATDEIYSTLNAPGFAVTVNRADLATRALPNGLYALTGYPQQSFPQLATTGYTVDYVLSAPGFISLPVSVAIPVGATFPVTAAAAALRRLPVRMQGRVVSEVTRQPIAGASIASVDPSPAPAVHVTALRSPLYFSHAGGASVQAVSIAVTGSATLTQNVLGGDQVLNLSTRTGLAPGSVIRLTASAGVLLEYAVVDQVGPGAASAPGEVNLRNALNRSYAASATAVDFVSATASGAVATLSAPADGGDGALLASALLGGTVEIAAGTPEFELHEVGAISDSDGYYGLDGIGRVQEIVLQASNGSSNQTVTWFIEFDQPLNQVDFRI
jgi:hypothetical protein